jgi:hypothetical protein
MNIADLILKLVRFLLQKIIYPILPVNMPIISYDSLASGLIGLEHNFSWALASLSKFFNLELLFGVLLLITTAEVIFWLVRAGKWIIEIVRG